MKYLITYECLMSFSAGYLSSNSCLVHDKMPILFIIITLFTIRINLEDVCW